MGALPSYNQLPKLNQSVHGTLDIGVCGYDLKNGQMKPTKCSNNMSLNESNHMTSLISDLNIPNLPINTCVPVGPKIGVELKKDLNSKPNDTVSNFKLSTCSHDYKLQHEIPQHLRIDTFDKTFVDMNKDKLMKLNMAMLNESPSNMVHIQPYPNKPNIQPRPRPIININKKDEPYGLPNRLPTAIPAIKDIKLDRSNLPPLIR
tara:strand:+ start:3391 stop:4002 length:612 start_codon:yes stop_codon:yes gene_type:complete